MTWDFIGSIIFVNFSHNFLRNVFFIIFKFFLKLRFVLSYFIITTLFRKHLGCSSARYSDPTWINHRDIFLAAGFTDVQPYPYRFQVDTLSTISTRIYKYLQTGSLDWTVVISSLAACPPRTVVVLHAQVSAKNICRHTPPRAWTRAASSGGSWPRW